MPVSVNWGGPILRSLYWGSYYFGSMLGARDVLEVLLGVLIVKLLIDWDLRWGPRFLETPA